jgi:hypothetical protein
MRLMLSTVMWLWETSLFDKADGFWMLLKIFPLIFYTMYHILELTIREGPTSCVLFLNLVK